MKIEERIKNALITGIIGDALGVPVEFSTRQELTLCSVKNMIGYGRYDEPEGTWSDDTSLSLCTMESLLRGYDLDDIGNTFCKWLFDSYWTASGYVFDAGLTTFMALDRIKTDGKSARDSGGQSEDDNGNGSLMRILPAALYFHHEPADVFLTRIHEISAITHAHPRTLVGCGIYSLLIKALFGEVHPKKAFRDAVGAALDYYATREPFKDELTHFTRIISYDIESVTIDEIRSSGYIVDTLEAAIWCFLQNGNAKDVVLAAVNLGLDTDTTGMVAGGLAGFCYGTDSLPHEWPESLSRQQEIEKLIDRFSEVVVSHAT